MPESASRLALRISRRLAQHACKAPLLLRADAGVVTFTFDDAPASACEIGARTLERHGVRGTFYIAGGLTNGSEEGKPCHTRDHLVALLAAGHELGCHSYSHVRCDTLTARELEQELDRNAAFLAEFGLDPRTLDFAFPFGAYAYNAKRICGKRFRSSRITGGGVHEEWADLNALKTHRFYDVDGTGGDYAIQLARTASSKGWLIVNTHEVETAPSRFGTTPGRLDDAIAAALAAGCKVLPVNAAIDYWQQHATSANG